MHASRPRPIPWPAAKRPSAWAVLLAATACLPADCPAQADSIAIASIRSTVAAINAGTGYATRRLDNEQILEEMTDGGGELTGYFKDGRLVKITERIGLSSCVNTMEYCFHDGALAFVHVQGRGSRYADSLATFDPGIQDLSMECRFYFDRGRIIRQRLQGKTRCSGQIGKDWIIDFPARAEGYKRLLEQE